MSKKIKKQHADVVAELSAAEAFAVRKACNSRIGELASTIDGKATDFQAIEELATLADALLVLNAAISWGNVRASQA